MPQRRVRQRFGDGVRHLVHDVLGRARGRDDAVVGFHDHAGKPRFARGGHVRQPFETLGAGHRQGAQLARLDEAQGRRRIAGKHLHLVGQQGRDGGGGALVGHMHDVDARLLLQQFAAQMWGGDVAGGAVVVLARVLLGAADEGRQRLVGQGRVHHDHLRNTGHQRHVLDAADVVRHLHDVRQAGDGARHAEAERIAVRRGSHGGVHAYGAAGARLVFDHDGLAQPLAQRWSQQPRQVVHRAARRIRHDQPDGLAGPGLRGLRHGRKRRAQQYRSHRQCGCSFHCLSPDGAQA
ncbi:hypothetical protein D3C71_1427260 [compost metagenome]